MIRQAILVGVLSFAFFVMFHFYMRLGYNIHYKKHHPGECRKVNGIDFGSEDLEVTQDGIAFITSGLDSLNAPAPLKAFMKANNPKGRIFLFDFKKPDRGARPLRILPSKTFDPDNFHPHGLSLLEDKVKGQHLVYVISHLNDGGDRVEKFRFMPVEDQLQHLRSFNDSKMYNTNDLALLEEDRFYISNFQHFDFMPLVAMENLLPIALCKLFFVDGDAVTEVASSLHGPNGVTLSRDKKFLYVALPMDRNLHVYERQEDNSLTLIQDVPDLHTFLDNFQLSQTGDSLLAGAHPLLHKVMAFMGDPTLTSPSSILRLPLSNGRVIHEDITELFYDHGDLISGSSVAQIYGNQMLIGSVINKLVVCDLYGKTQGSK